MSHYFPFYKNTQIPGSKELHADYIDEQLRAFKLNDDSELEVELLSSFIEKRYTERYQKSSHILSTGSRVDVITKDNEYDSFCWHTTANKVKQAVRYGVVATYSVTSKVISALGKYRTIQLERIQDGYISDRYQAKLALLDIYQDRIEALEKIESLVNAGTSRADADAAIIDYMDALEFIKGGLYRRILGTGLDYSELKKSLDADIRQAEKFRIRNQRVDITASTGIHSALTFVKAQMIQKLREMQGYNQAITYNNKRRFALTRGNLNSCIEDAELIIEEYEAPPRDRIEAQHQGGYGGVASQVVYDARHHCRSAKDERRALLAISFIEKMHEVDVSNPKQPALISGINRRSLLQISHMTSWRVDGFLYGIKRTGAWLANTVIKLTAGLIEFPLTLFVEPLTFGLATPLFNGLRKWAVTEIKVSNSFHKNINHEYRDLYDVTHRARESLGMRVRYFAINAFKNSIRDIGYAALDVGRSLTVHLFDYVINDYRDGERNKPDLDTVLQRAEEEIKQIKLDKDKALDNILTKINPDAERLESDITIDKRLATPDYVPSAGDNDDPFNSLAYGVEIFMNFFTHNIHAKHPFAGAIFSTTYVLAGLAVMAPKSVAFLGKDYLSFTQGLGYGMAKDPYTAAVSSGCTQAQVMSAQYEFLLHGPKSWAVSNAISFEKDPFTSAIYAGTALLLGHLIVYELHIPWLSDMLKEDMGTLPASSLGFVGAKLGIGVFELLKEEEDVKLEKSEYVAKLRAMLGDRADAVFDKIKSSTMTEKDIHRAQIIYFIANNAKHLPHMSADQKHAIYQQVKQNFSFQEEKSLYRFMNPRGRRSIFRTLVNMVVGYPANVIRLLMAVVSSVRHGNLNPVKSASTDFGIKILKDTNRLVRASTKFTKTALSFVRRHLKTAGDIILNSGLSRAESILTGQSKFGQTVYRASAWFDCQYEKARQIFSAPVDAAMRVVTAEQPASVITKSSSTYARLAADLSANFAGVTSLPSASQDSLGDSGEVVNDDLTPLLFETKGSQVQSLHLLA